MQITNEICIKNLEAYDFSKSSSLIRFMGSMKSDMNT